MASILRPSQRHINIPAIGVTTSRRAVASAAAGWWAVAGKTCVAAYQPKGAADLAASYVNLETPGTYNAALGVAPGLDATGWTFTGTKYLKTGLIPADAWSMLFRCKDSGNVQGPVGVAKTNVPKGGFYILPRNNTRTQYANGLYAVSTVNGADESATGVFGFAGKAAFFNGIPDGTIVAGTGAYGTLDIWIGGLNIDGALTIPITTGSIQAIAIYSDTLTAGEMAAVSAAMAAL